MSDNQKTPQIVIQRNPDNTWSWFVSILNSNRKDDFVGMGQSNTYVRACTQSSSSLREHEEEDDSSKNTATI